MHRRLETAIGQRVGRGNQGHHVEEGRTVGRRRRQAQQLDGVQTRGHRKIGRSVLGVTGARRRDRAHSRAIDKQFDLLGLRLGIGPLGGQEGNVVGARGQSDRLADAAAILDKADLRAIGSVGVADGKPLWLALTPASPRELPGRANRGDLEAVRGLHRLLETSVNDRARCRSDGHRIDQGRAVGRARREAQQLDRMWAGSHAEVRRFVGCVTRPDRRDHADLRTVDKHLDLLFCVWDSARWAAWKERV